MVTHIADFLPRHREDPAKKECATRVRIRSACSRLRGLIKNPDLSDAYIAILGQIESLDIRQIDRVIDLIKLTRARKCMEEDCAAIAREVAEKGFALRFTQLAPPRARFPGFKVIDLRYNVSVHAYDTEDQSDAGIGDSWDEQDMWVDELSFRPSLSEELDFDADDDYEPYGWNRGDPGGYLAHIPVSLFYIPRAIPRDVRRCRVINEDGTAVIFTIPGVPDHLEKDPQCECDDCQIVKSGTAEWQGTHCILVAK